ncbi:plasmid replication protein [Paenibacillus sp. PsM32]|uniref:plasmid replication protein n=1 Tax=unclassified Paenibacillus TaxID=185978 RepID=UPI0023672C6D|nr:MULTISPECIES: plasmid replication protein [unclassified Paenibacillus]MDN4617655.1 plasmid replication protein [Paenibacillus sp. PsM32]WDF52889.1 plasmid replication protein [Paenibacillus sp. KACC 21273]
MRISLKYGFFGWGMGGTSIAFDCADVPMSSTDKTRPYTALLINSNEIDLTKLSDLPNVKKLLLKGYERGVGRDIVLGQKAFEDNQELIKESVISYFKDRDYIFISCGLGGGTGTGALLEAIRLLHTSGFAGRFGLLLTLPRRNEGRKVLSNALQRLQTLKRAMSGLGAIIIVDNEQLFQVGLAQEKPASVEEFMKSCNRHIAKLLHELNTVTSSYIPYGNYHFDASEWLNMLHSSGCLHIAKCVLPINDINIASPVTYMDKLKQSVLNGELSTGYDLSDAASSAVSIVADQSCANELFTHVFVEEVQSFLHNTTPTLDENPVATYGADQPGLVTIYTVVSGLNFPDSVSKLAEEAAELERRVEERNQKTDMIAVALAGFNKEVKKEEADLESLLFGDSSSAPDRDTPKDPFDFLNELK